MKITIKTLQQKSFSVVIDENETVLTLKQKIQEEQGANFPVEGLKLIYSGKILNDPNKISEYSIQETSFVVVMVSKAKVAPSKPPQASTSSTTSSSTASGGASVSVGATTSPQTPAETKPQQETTPTASGGQSVVVPETEQVDSGDSKVLDAASRLVTGTDYETAIENLMGMGYTREECMRAMQASFNNPDRAAEYLMTGIPQTVSEEEPQQGGGGQEGDQRQEREPSAEVGGAGEGEGSAGENPLAFLLRNPNFVQLRNEVARNPAMLPLILQSIGTENPELLQLINQNQEAFLGLLNTDEGGVPTPGQPGGVAVGPGGGPVLPGGGPRVPGAGPPGTISIPVTAQEKEAIDRLKSLGFREEMVIQAYFACDKNEELAANFLFSQAEDPN